MGHRASRRVERQVLQRRVDVHPVATAGRLDNAGDRGSRPTAGPDAIVRTRGVSDDGVVVEEGGCPAVAQDIDSAAFTGRVGGDRHVDQLEGVVAAEDAAARALARLAGSASDLCCRAADASRRGVARDRAVDDVD